MRVKIQDYYYYNSLDKEEKYNAPIFVANCRDEKNNFHMIQVLDKEVLAPFFGVLKKEHNDLLEVYSQIGEVPPEIKYTKPGVKSPYGEGVTNIYCTFPFQVNRLRKAYNQTFQADIKWEKMAMSKIIELCNLEGPYMDVPSDYAYKYLKVSDIKTVKKEDFFIVVDHIAYWDIEASSKGFTKRIKYEDYKNMPILSITVIDNYKDERHVFVWKGEFTENLTYTLNDYYISDNVNNTYIHTIKKMVRHEFKSEQEMFISFFDYFSDQKFDLMLGYWSTGGMKKPSFGGKTRRKWYDGFDMQCLYERTKHFNLLENMQKMSTCPILKKHWGNAYEGVFLRSGEGKHQPIVKGLGQIDFVISNDWIQFAQKYYDFRGSRLADWASFFLPYNKLDKKGKQVYYFWEQGDVKENDIGEFFNGVYRVKGKGIEFMCDYNLIDTEILVDLNNKFNVSKNQIGRTSVSISPFEDALYPSKLHDHYKLTKYQKLYSFDTKYQDKFKRTPKAGKKQIGDKFTITLEELSRQISERTGKEVNYKSLEEIHKIGGFVPAVLHSGVYEWVIVIDFSKFYPNMIKSTNAGIVTAIDLDRYDKDFVYDKNSKRYNRRDLIETPLGFFRKDIKGINSDLFDDWMIRRVEAQSKLTNYLEIHKTTETDKYKMLWSEQFNIKNFMNSAFGIMGLRIDRAYSLLGFNSCTASCQDVMMFCINHLKNWDIKIISGDTDSVFLQLQATDLGNAIEEGEAICERLNRKINDYMRTTYNVDNPMIKIGLETVSDKFYVSSKKHYIKRNLYVDGVILDKPELEIKGLDLKKRASSQLAADNQKAMINVIFFKKEPMESIENYIMKVEEELETYPWSYVCKRGALNKELDKYLSGTESAVAARNTLKYLERYYGPGSNPFIGVFKYYPPKMNGSFIAPNGDFKMSFDPEDEVKLKELGFILNYDHIRETECVVKTKHFLSTFDEDWISIKENQEVGDFCDL